MAARGMETLKAKKVFMNNIDTYSSKHIVQFLSERLVAAPGPELTEEEEERKVVHHSGEKAFLVVGSVGDASVEGRPEVQEEYSKLSSDSLLSRLMDCDVVIYNISQNAMQLEEALWAVTALHDNMKVFSGPKMFILISTVMTWACSKPVDPEDPELPFTDEVFYRRRAHPSFNLHLELEKKVVKLGKTNRKLFSTYVVASGLQYGMGEHVFHFFFKTAWLGEEPAIPLFGKGKNILPTIHISDLASVIHNVIVHHPTPYYLLAVDQSRNTLEDIVKTVASVLGLGKIETKPVEEIFLVRELSLLDIESLQVNLRMEAVHAEELFSMSWMCKSGLVENVEKVVEEYRENRRLQPLRVCVLGPPAVGKSSVCKNICDHYGLHHIRVKETISETITQLEAAAVTSDPESGIYDPGAELLFVLKDVLEQKGGRLEEPLLLKVLKEKLTSKPCRNQGYVLDGFPKTNKQAKALFSDMEPELEDGRSLRASVDTRILPELVLVLDAADSFLQERVMNLPEKAVQEQHYEWEHFLLRLRRHREREEEEERAADCLEELEVSLLSLEVTSSSEPDTVQLMQKIFDRMGKPRNYSRSIQEERRKVEDRMTGEEQEKAEEERSEEEEARSRAARWEEWRKRAAQVRQQEEEELELQSVPVREYLMEQVMPTLSRGLVECCNDKPDDPVDFLAEFLLKNNPSNY